MDDAKKAVERGAELFAEWERATKEGKLAAKELVAVYEAIRDVGHISPFECHAYSMETVAMGMCHRAAVMELHHKLVRRCVDLGIDVPAPTDPDIPEPKDGGGGR